MANISHHLDCLKPLGHPPMIGQSALPLKSDLHNSVPLILHLNMECRIRLKLFKEFNSVLYVWRFIALQSYDIFDGFLVGNLLKCMASRLSTCRQEAVRFTMLQDSNKRIAIAKSVADSSYEPQSPNLIITMQRIAS